MSKQTTYDPNTDYSLKILEAEKKRRFAGRRRF